jgi:hypothetical protein
MTSEDDQIRALLLEAKESGDADTVYLCRAALDAENTAVRRRARRAVWEGAGPVAVAHRRARMRTCDLCGAQHTDPGGAGFTYGCGS